MNYEFHIFLLLVVFYRVYLVIRARKIINKVINSYVILNQKFDSAKHKMLYEFSGQNDDYLHIDEDVFKISKKGIKQSSLNYAFDEIKIEAIKSLKSHFIISEFKPINVFFGITDGNSSVAVYSDLKEFISKVANTDNVLTLFDELILSVSLEKEVNLKYIDMAKSKLMKYIYLKTLFELQENDLGNVEKDFRYRKRLIKLKKEFQDTDCIDLLDDCDRTYFDFKISGFKRVLKKLNKIRSYDI